MKHHNLLYLHLFLQIIFSLFILKQFELNIKDILEIHNKNRNCYISVFTLLRGKTQVLLLSPFIS